MITARIKRKKYSFYAFDVESHNDTESIAKKETSIWLGSFINDENKKEDENSYIYSIEEFLERCKALVNAKRGKDKNASRPIRNICIYIYNLSFEWSFILPVLLKLGYEFAPKIEDKDEYKFNSISTRSVSSVWQVNIKMNKSAGNIMLRDLSKLFPGGLGKVAKSFNLPTQKGEIDYRLNRLHNHKVTQKEKYYCFNDTRIIIDILIEMVRRGDKDFFNADSSSSYAMLKMIKKGFHRTFKPYQEFRKKYPALEQEETDFLRKSVGGGITYAPSLWQFKDIKKPILHIDLHQAHPSSAYYNFFPYGKGTYHQGKPSFSVFESCCCHVLISYTGVKLHSIIQLIGIDLVEDYELTIWDFEIPTMKKCYIDLEIKYIDYYSYKNCPLPWRDFYKENYIKRLKSKADKDEFGIMYWKLLNNGSYGKLLEKPHNEIFENCLDEDSIITSKVIDKSDIAVNAKYTYLPIGSSIPARTRVTLVESALKLGWQKVVYFDTDSIFCLYDEETKAIWESNQFNKQDFLGGWGLEEILERAQFTAPKRYKTEKVTNQGSNFIMLDTDIKMAGINFNEEWSYDDINIINSSWEVKRAYRVKGGTIIDVQRKDISIQDKYKNIALKNLK